MIKPTATEFTHMLMDPVMRVTGETTSNMGKAKKHGLMGLSTMETILIPRKRAEACTPGLMVISTSVTGETTKFMVMVYMCGPTAECTAANGRTT